MSQFPVASRIRRLPSQFFAAIVQTANRMREAGHDVINLGQGNPDQPTPPHVIEALVAAARDPAHHGYSPFSGLASLKQAISRWYQTRYGVRVDPETEVCILIGAKLGLQEISLCYLEPGDICLMPDPGYPDYWSGVALAGGEPYPLPLTAENGFIPDLDAVPAEVRSRARLMFLNYPGNPTGAVAAADWIRTAVDWARAHGIILAFDSAYGDLVYDGRRPLSFLQVPGARAAGIEFHSLSKSFNMAGWRIAFCAGNAEIIRQMNLLQDHLNCSQAPAIQVAAAAALSGPYDSVAELRALYEQRRNAFVAACREVGWAVPPSAGSFFVWCPVPAGQTTQSFTERLLHDAHVVVAPGTAFGAHGEGYVRVSLTAPAERLAEAAHRIGRLGLMG